MLEHVLLFSVIIVHVQAESGLCLNGQHCPDDRPFCTPVGCVFRCPDNVFVKGKECVQDCGEEFIQNRACIPKCPVSYTYIREEIVSTEYTFYKHKLCEQTCPAGMFISESYCLDACPLNSFFLLNSTCVNQCPDSYNYRRNITKDKSTVAVECLFRCPVDFPFSYKNECIDLCRHPLYQFQQECVDACPNTTNVIYSSQKWKDDTTVTVSVCANTCPGHEKALNGKCLNKCPLGYVIYNQTCLNRCPADAPYTDIPTDQFSFYNEDSDDNCVKHCPPETYVNGTTCVEFCPLVYNTTCVDVCPVQAPYLCDWENEEFCRKDYYPDNPPNYCVNHCPEHTHVAGTACISSCPNDLIFFNKTCVKDCPEEFKYTAVTTFRKDEWSLEKYTFKECVANCSENLFLDNMTCFENCPDNKYKVTDERLCVAKCPVSHPYIEYEKTCVSHCDENRAPVDGLCKDNHGYADTGCPKGSLVVLNVCNTKSDLIAKCLLFSSLSLIWLMLVIFMFTNFWEDTLCKSLKKPKIETYTDEDEDLLIPNREDEPDDDSAILNV